MRGRVVVLLVLVLVAAVVAVAAIFLMGGDETEEPAGTAEAVDTGTGETQPTQETTGPTPAVAGDVVPVVIALQDLPRGFRITEEFARENDPAAAVGIMYYPAASFPVNSFQQLGDVVGFIVRSDIAREAPILSTQLVNDVGALASRGLASVGSDAALLLPAGKVAVTIPLDRTGIGSVAFAPQPGDYVDVILSFLFIEVDETFQTRRPNRISVISRTPDGQLVFSTPIEGRPEPSTLSSLGVLIIPSEAAQRPRLLTQRTVERAYVLHTGLFPLDGQLVGKITATPFNTPTPEPRDEDQQQQPPTPTLPLTPTDAYPTVITLAVDPQEALVLVWALDAQIPITLALRSASPSEGSAEGTTAVTLQYLIETYNIPQPPILPFALEPAITSLRTTQLDLFTTFTVSTTSTLGNDTGQPGIGEP